MSTDRYLSLTALAAALRDGIDYRIRVLDRGSWLTVIAPHGGYIEAGTSALARAVAGRSYNLYDFQSLRADIAKEMHVTSTRFRDPALTELLKRSRTALSLHCMGTCHEQVIWLGGRNYSLKERVLHELRSAGFSTNPDSPMYRGESKDNVVNLVCHEGVQLELSQELLEALYHGAPFVPRGSPRGNARFERLAGALKRALSAYRRSSAFAAPCRAAEPAA